MQNVQIVGVLNVTPDSYFDGGKYDHIDLALERAQELIGQGADIIDVGGESTGPGSEDVSVDEELARVIPVLEKFQISNFTFHISVDTYKAEVAKEAIKAGATMINDVTAGRGDPEMFSVIAASEVQYVMMYAKDATARTTVNNQDYNDVIATISAFLQERIDQAVAAGIDRSNIIIDPGMGHFISAKPEYSFEVLRRLKELTVLAPVYVSPSRKSFLAGPENLPPQDRLPATIVASAIAALHGASYIRTHDVQEVRRGCEVLEQTIKQNSNEG